MTPWGVEGVTVVRGQTTVLENVSVTFAPGRVTRLVGPNGSGKTTLLRVISGLETPQKGRVLGPDPSWRESDWARAMACVLGPVSVELPFCVEEVLLSSHYPDGGRWLDPSETLRGPMLDLLGRLEVFAEGPRRGLERTYSTLSAGERQLVDLVRGVLQDTPVLVLDEPMSALDLRHRLLAQGLLAEEASRGRTVIESLHDLRHLPEGDVLVLHRGRVAAAGTAEVLNAALLARVWGVVPSEDGYHLV